MTNCHYCHYSNDKKIKAFRYQSKDKEILRQILNRYQGKLSMDINVND